MEPPSQSNAPPALPPRPAEQSNAEQQDQAKLNMFYLYAAGAGAVVLAIALTSPKLFLGFLLGAVGAAGALVGAIYYFLNLGVAMAAADKQKEIEKKLNQPVMEATVRPLLLFTIFLSFPALKPSNSHNYSIPGLYLLKLF